MKSPAFLTLTIALFALPAAAEMKYYPDPVHKSFGAGDPPAMADVHMLAEDDDARAQFMLGDMFEKGKGGLPRDLKSSRLWFARAALAGEGHGFIRLGAEAQRAGETAAAWKWFSLALDSDLDDGTRDFAKQERRKLEEGFSKEEKAEAKKALRGWDEEKEEIAAEAAKEKEDYLAKADARAAIQDKQAKIKKEPKNEQN